MDEIPDTAELEGICRRILRRHGARFAFRHGSRVDGRATPNSDLVLDTAPLELAGRVALHGRLLFEQDPAERVAWQATTRKVYLDEQPRIRQARRDFVEARGRG